MNELAKLEAQRRNLVSFTESTEYSRYCQAEYTKDAAAVGIDADTWEGMSDAEWEVARMAAEIES